MGLAFLEAEFEIAGIWDCDKHAIRSYRENIGKYAKAADIREMSYKDIPQADVWAFGFPCIGFECGRRAEGICLAVQGMRRETGCKPGAICRRRDSLPMLREAKYEGSFPIRDVY